MYLCFFWFPVYLVTRLWLLLLLLLAIDIGQCQPTPFCKNLVRPNGTYWLKAISFYWDTLLLVHGDFDDSADLFVTKLRLNRSDKSIRTSPLTRIKLENSAALTEPFEQIFGRLQPIAEHFQLFTFHFLDLRRLVIWFKSNQEQNFVSLVYQTQADYVLSGTRINCKHFQILYQLTTEDSLNPIPTKSVFPLSYIATTADLDQVHYLTGEIIIDRSNQLDHNFEFYINGNGTSYYLGFDQQLTRLYLVTDWVMFAALPDYLPFESEQSAVPGKWRAFLYYDYVYLVTGNLQALVLFFRQFNTDNFDEPNLLVEIPLGRMKLNDLFDCQHGSSDLNRNRPTFPVGKIKVSKIQRNETQLTESEQRDDYETESSTFKFEAFKPLKLAEEAQLFDWVFTVQCFILSIIVLVVSVLISLLVYLCSIRLRLQYSSSQAVHTARFNTNSRSTITTTTTTTTTTDNPDHVPNVNHPCTIESEYRPHDPTKPQTLLIPIPSPSSIVSISTRKELVTIQSVNNNLVISHKRILLSPDLPNINKSFSSSTH